MNKLHTAATDRLTLGELRLYKQVAELIVGWRARDPAPAPDEGLSQNDILARLPELANTVAKGRLNAKLHDIEDAVSGPPDQPRPTPPGRGEPGRKPSGLFVRADRVGIQDLTPLGHELLQLAKDLLREVEQHARRSADLRVAASEAFTTYVYPAIVRDEVDRDGASPARPTPSLFRPAMIRPDGDLDLGRLDLAVAWDAYETGQPENVVATPLELTKTIPHVIFHPLHPFGGWVQKHRAAKGADFGAKLLGEVCKHTILYPKALRRLATALEQAHASKSCVLVESFPTVVTHVAMRVGIGLFPGWGWLLEQLKRESHIYHLPLPLGDFDMRLVCYEPRQGRNPKAAEFINALREKLAALEDRPRDGSLWQPVDARTAFPALFPRKPGRFRRDWDAYYINTGSGDMPYPRWRKGEWKFGPPAVGAGKRGPDSPHGCDGTFEMFAARKDRGKRVFGLRAEFGTDYLRVVSAPLSPDLLEGDPRPAFLCFQEVFSRPSTHAPAGDPDVLILGFITRSRPGRPTVAPFILCPHGTPLTASDFRQVENLVECHAQGDLGDLHESSKR